MEYSFHVRQWFLSPKDWDKKYNVGDNREVIVHFTFNGEIDLAKQQLINNSKLDDLEIEFL